MVANINKHCDNFQAHSDIDLLKSQWLVACV